MLWGTVILNTERHPTALDVTEGLIHETAHHVLFGLSRDEPLVENAVAESYESPLRRDSRPMDGVYHATFVCARIHYVFNALIASGRLQDEQLHHAEARLADARRRFRGGLETVKRHARLTDNGGRIMAAAEQYMLGGV